MKTRNLIIVSICLSIASCTLKTDSESGFYYHPEVEIINSDLRFDDIIEDFKYIKLETNDSCLIGEVKQLIIHKSRIYVLSDGVFCFNMDGKFQFAISKKGRGPGEFLQILNFGIDDDRLYLNSPRKILFYDSNSGEYLKSVDTDYYIKYLCLDENSMYMDVLPIPQNKPDQIGRFFISQMNDQKMIEGVLPDIIDNFIAQPFVTYNQCLYYSDPLLIQVYKTHNKAVVPYIHFQFGDKTPTTSDVENLLNMKPRTFDGYEKPYLLENVFEIESAVTGAIRLNGRLLTILFDKKSNKALAFDLLKSKEGERYEILGLKISASYEDYFCSIITAPSLAGTAQKLKDEGIGLDSSHPDISKIMPLLETELSDNPIIGMYKFRKPDEIKRRSGQ